MSDSDPTRALTGSPDLAGGPGRSGLLLGRYRLEAAIGSGGHGSVWRAFDAKLERSVAVKVLARSSAAHDRRAEREARAAARLNHPGIVALYEFGEDADAVYLVSELVDGRTLADLEGDGLVSDRDLAEIGVALCDALAHAHRKQVVHRDVKPQNVLVVADPAAGAGFVKLTDFGVARLLSEDPLTVTGGVVGTVAYMAPEQAAGQQVAEPADVYSLALTLHEGWSGLRPGGPSSTHRPLTQLRRDLPPTIAAVIDRCLVTAPDQRPGLDELRLTLEQALTDLADEGGLVAPGPLERIGLTIPLRPRANVPGLPSA
ncbi:MAG: serine/threonine protein kinase, partial [Thermoleophilaceae bacterium]|nr:serine/threonine protein kinase [Thermoleophilaceae bacterium]